MKTLYQALCIGGMALMAVSCDYTDLQPTDQIGDEMIFSSVSALEQTVTGAYAQMSAKQIIRVTAVLSDDVIKGGQNGGAGDDTYQWTYTASTGEHADIWSKECNVINQVNRILKGAESVEATTDEEVASKNNSIATAKFLRAYNSLELLLFFSDIEKEDSYGIPYVKEPVVLETPGRNTVGECFDYMIQDLTDARPLLRQVAPDDPVYVSQTAVDALLARIYLYKKDYGKAYQYADAVLQQKSFATMGEYTDIWSDKSNADIIWKLKRAVGEETIGTIFWGADNSSSFEAAPELINSYLADDIRLNLFIADGVDRDGVAVKKVNKYKGTEANVGLADGKMLRSSEMQLIKAEAIAYTDLDKANVLLNDLRRERISGWVDQNYGTLDEFMEELLLERRRELCYEGHRFFDMRRFGKSLYKPVIKKTLEAGNFRWLMPIPLGELQGNSVIAKQQNPGY
ncbi:RagB/SusD family nutrient uptake outer membrane protein [Phocaeicola plebeius]|jgi:hypothetical protein|uniref:RagB/SusD family nutrient uptake outer membrane protein n=1 Tax=Phocaeicola plebeius TaxID=310297 RepID=UPI0039F56281